MSEPIPKTKKELAVEALAGLSETELREVESEIQVKKIKVNQITIDETGLIEYVNTTTTPNTKFDAFAGKLLNNRRRFEPALRIRIKNLSTIPEGGTKTEDALLKIVPYLFQMLGSWGYQISDRNINRNPDNTQVTNIYELQKFALDPET